MDFTKLNQVKSKLEQFCKNNEDGLASLGLDIRRELFDICHELTTEYEQMTNRYKICQGLNPHKEIVN